MNQKSFTFAIVVLIASLAARPLAAQNKTWNPQAEQNPTTPWAQPLTETNLNLELNDDVKELHFIQGNNDPFVYTKTYVLKHADPYAMRNGLLHAVQSKRLADNDTRVECIKYNDGLGMVLVTAEGYRFDKKQCGDGMSIDEIVETLDVPNLKSLSGTPRFMYFPRNVPAADLKLMIDRVGINYMHPDRVNQFTNNSNELQYTKGFTATDDGLNALFLYVPPYDVKQAYERLKIYDIPIPEARIICSVYEIAAENDGKIGADFQSWKNGPGADFFNLGGRWRRGWNPVQSIADGTKYSSTKYIQFSPKWNSKYLDFLASEGRANVLTTGELRIKNNQTGTLRSRTMIPEFDAVGSAGTGGLGITYDEIDDATFRPSWTNNVNGFRVRAYRRDGAEVTINNAFNGSMVLGRVTTPSGDPLYSLDIDATPNTAQFVIDGKLIGDHATVQRLSLSRAVYDADQNAFVWRDYQPSWSGDLSMTYAKGPRILSKFVSANISETNDYGFRLQVTPRINKEATRLDLSLANTSLIGFQSNGSIRASTSSVETEVMIDNDGTELVIGGLEKKSFVRGVTKVPWLGSLPLIGWLFGSESESLKTSRLVTTLKCVVTMSEEDLDRYTTAQIEKIRSEIPTPKDSDFNDPNYGFNQFHLDKTKQTPEPLP